MKNTKTVLVIMILFISLSTFAQNNISVGGGFGTLGSSVEVTYELSDKLKIRTNLNGLSLDDIDTDDLDHDSDFGNLDYETDFSIGSIGLQLDYYPFMKKFFTSIGVYAISNDFDLESDLRNSRSYKLGNSRYTGREIGTITGEAELETVAPYIGAGWKIPFGSSRWSFLIDLGVLYINKDYDVSLKVEKSPLKNDENFIRSVKEEEEELEDDLSTKVYPVGMFKFMYTF